MFILTDDFIRTRITELRIKKGVSEYKMSLDMGHSKSYIQSIVTGRALPSLAEFLYMCEYLNVTPSDFFNENIDEPILVQQLRTSAKDLPTRDLLFLIQLADRLNDDQEKEPKKNIKCKCT